MTEDVATDLGARLEAAIKTLDACRIDLVEVLPVMRRSGHPRLNSYLGYAHRAGFTLEELGEMLGCTRERIRQRIAAGDPGPAKHQYLLTAEHQAHLRRLRSQADGRARKRADATWLYRTELARHREAGATLPHLAEVLAVTPHAVAEQLRRHYRDVAEREGASA